MKGLVAMGAVHLPPGFSYARRLTWTKAAGLVDIKGDGGTVALKNGAKSELLVRTDQRTHSIAGCCFSPSRACVNTCTSGPGCAKTGSV